MLHFIDKEDFYSLQKLYDLFFLKKQGSTEVLNCPAKYKKQTLKLYQRLFITGDSSEIQEIIVQSNKMISNLVKEYGDFTKDSVFQEIDSLDQMELSDLADSFI